VTSGRHRRAAVRRDAAFRPRAAQHAARPEAPRNATIWGARWINNRCVPIHTCRSQYRWKPSSSLFRHVRSI